MGEFEIEDYDDGNYDSEYDDPAITMCNYCDSPVDTDIYTICPFCANPI